MQPDTVDTASRQKKVKFRKEVILEKDGKQFNSGDAAPLRHVVAACRYH